MNKRKSLPAIALLLTALIACKSDPQATARDAFAKGEQHFAEKRVNEAIIEFRRAIQADPRLGQARLKLGDAYAANGDGSGALREYVRAAELLPDDQAAQVKAAKFMLLAGQYTDAKAVGEKLLAKSPDNVEAQILIANALAGLKDFGSAVDAFEDAALLDPNRATTFAELGAAQMLKGDPVAAEAAFRKAVEVNPKSAMALSSLANFAWSKGNVEEAEQLLKRAVDAEPKNVVVNRAMAMFYVVRNRAAEAEPYLKTVAEVSKGPGAKFALAEYYLRLGRFDDARAIVTPFVEDEKTFVDASIRLARIEAFNEKNTEAQRILDSVLAREPKNVYALLLRGQIYLVENNSVNALTALQTAVEGNPNSIAAQLALARTHALRGSTKEAMKAYNDALKIDGNNGAARMGLAKLQLSVGGAADAVPLLMKVVAENPGNLEARLLLLQGYTAVGDLTQATALANDLLKSHGNSAAVQIAVGALATAKKDDTTARQSYSRALAAAPGSYQALAGLLNAELKAKSFGSARALIEKHLAQNPGDATLNLMAAQTYFALGDAAAMEKALKKTVEADPHSLQAYAMLAQMYYKQGRLDFARTELEKYVKTAPASVPGNTMLGTVQDLQGQKAEAKASYQRALQVDPRAAVAANNLAWIDANTEGSNLDVALQLAQSAKSQMPNSHEVDDTLGWIYYKKGLHSRAIESFENSKLKQPMNPGYAYHLGLAYNKNGDTAKARAELERALKLNPKFDGAADARKVLESIK